MRALLVASTLIALGAWAAPKRARPRGTTAPKVPMVKDVGNITWVGAEFAFVDKGTAEGVTAGTQLMLSRSGKASGTCTTDLVAEHSARCVGSNVRVGDRFNLQRPAPETPKVPEPLPSEAELKRRAGEVESAEWQLRTFDAASRAFGGGRRFEAALSHTTFFNAASGSATNQQRIDLIVSDVEIWKGLRASADLTVLNFSSRPEVTRTLFTQTPALLVRQLELGFRRPDVAIGGGLGRTWVTTGAGLLVVDGAHASVRLGTGFELGAFGGLLPDAGRLTPSLSQWSAGAFARAQLSLGDGAAASTLQVAGRAGYAVRDTLGGRFEAALSGSLWTGPLFDLHASTELAFGQTMAPAGIDAARLDLGIHPSEKLLVTLSGRYRGLPVSGLTEVGLVSPGLRALHADAYGSYQVVPGVLVGLRGGVASDFMSAFTQARVGPELAMPSLLGGPVSLGVGYVEEFGWLRGRSASFSISVIAGRIFRLSSRTSLFHQQAAPTAEGLRDAELGSSLAVEVSPWPFLGVRVLVVGRQNLGERFAPFGTLGAQVWGSY